MSRIQRAFERRFRELLGEVGARRREAGVRWLFARAREWEASGNLSLSHALAEENILLAEKVHRFRERQGQCRGANGKPLFCDAGLGGLARWLRASGCEAYWIQDISDADLVNEAVKKGAIIITTDSFLLDRRSIVQGEVQAVWVPPSLNKFEQLRLVRAELDIRGNDSRCMRCGGELIEVRKDTVRDRIPPKTFLWVDNYFECTRCRQLFWEGTHWQRVQKQLQDNRPRTLVGAVDGC